MHEHRSEDGDPVMAGSDLRGNGGPLHDECVATHQLKHKNEDVHHDDERSDHRQSHRTSRGIAEWNQASQLSLPSPQAMFALKQGVESRCSATCLRKTFHKSAGTDSASALHFEAIFVDFETLDLGIERSRGHP